MFKRQFRLTRNDFFLLERCIYNKMSEKGYDSKKHHEYAVRSSGSPITLELRLYITLRILSGASYLDMVWYGVHVRSVSDIFWRTICDIDESIDNINFPIDPNEIMQLVNNWATKRKDRHGFTTNMGTAVALDGFVIEIIKPDVNDLNGQDVGCYMNRKGFWGMISQLACAANAKVRYQLNAAKKVTGRINKLGKNAWQVIRVFPSKNQSMNIGKCEHLITSSVVKELRLREC